MHTITVVLMALSLLQEEEGWKAKEVKPYLDNGRPSPEQALIFLGTPQDFEKRLEARQSGDARQIEKLPPPKPGPDLSLYIVVDGNCQVVPWYQIKINQERRIIRVFCWWHDAAAPRIEYAIPEEKPKIREKEFQLQCRCHFVLGAGMSELTAGEYEIEIYYPGKETPIRKERVKLAE